MQKSFAYCFPDVVHQGFSPVRDSRGNEWIPVLRHEAKNPALNFPYCFVVALSKNAKEQIIYDGGVLKTDN